MNAASTESVYVGAKANGEPTRWNFKSFFIESQEGYEGRDRIKQLVFRKINHFSQ